MKVDFNNLRLQTAFLLDNVIKTLNNGKLPEENHAHVLLDDNTHKIGNILVDYEDLDDDINELRMAVITLICCYEEGNDECANMYDELEKNGGLSKF